MELFSFLSFHFMYVTVTVVTGHSVALSRRSHLFSTMSSLHDVLVHDKLHQKILLSWRVLVHDHSESGIPLLAAVDSFGQYGRQLHSCSI
jgi:hypothetical protein